MQTCLFCGGDASAPGHAAHCDGQQGRIESYEPTLDDAEDVLEAAALDFHQRNPHVLHEIVRVCLRVKRAGREHWSMKAAFEVVRYNAQVTTDHRTYKLNNNHTAHYARWIMRDVPELSEFFATREHGRVEQEYFE